MNTRIGTLVAAVTLVSITSGCSGMRNFLFGRGARCGACNQPEPAPAQTPPCQTCPAPCGEYSYSQPAGCYGAASVGSGCGCNVSDPYLNGEVIGTMPYEGQIIEEVVPGTVSPSDDRFVPRPTIPAGQ